MFLQEIFLYKFFIQNFKNLEKVSKEKKRKILEKLKKNNFL